MARSISARRARAVRGVERASRYRAGTEPRASRGSRTSLYCSRKLAARSAGGACRPARLESVRLRQQHPQEVDALALGIADDRRRRRPAGPVAGRTRRRPGHDGGRRSEVGCIVDWALTAVAPAVGATTTVADTTFRLVRRQHTGERQGHREEARHQRPQQRRADQATRQEIPEVGQEPSRHSDETGRPSLAQSHPPATDETDRATLARSSSACRRRSARSPRPGYWNGEIGVGIRMVEAISWRFGGPFGTNACQAGSWRAAARAAIAGSGRRRPRDAPRCSAHRSPSSTARRSWSASRALAAPP